MNEQNAAALINFFEQYSVFLGLMLNNEQEKLQALLSNSLPRIEHSITVAQADEKQMENMEQKRIKLLKGIGCDGFTMTQLVLACPQYSKPRLEQLCEEIKLSVSAIRFHNSKSMDVASTNIRRMNPEAAPIVPQHSSGTNPYQNANVKREDGASILETKI